MMKKSLYIFALLVASMAVVLSSCKKEDKKDEPQPQPEQEKELLTVTVSDVDMLSARITVEAKDSNVVYFVNAWPQASVDKYLIDHTEKELNESFVNYIVGDSITPEIFATYYCEKGNISKVITGLTPGSIYYAFAFTYDWKTQTVGDRFYKKAFKTKSQSEVTLSFDIKVSDVKATSANISVTPSDTSVYYRYEVVDSAFVASSVYGGGTYLGAAQYIMSYYKSYIDEYNSTYSTDYTFFDFPGAHAYRGKDEGLFEDLAADKLYHVIAFKTTQYADVVEPLTVKSFRTGK